MSAWKFEYTFPGYYEVRTWQSTQDEILGHAQRIAAASGPGYEADVEVGQKAARAGVVTATAKAIEDNANNNTLLFQMGRG